MSDAAGLNYRARKTFMSYEDIVGQDVFREVYIPVGDEKEQDLGRLIKQDRL